jgi:formylglycine-generating enzyme required for sulfatase activity
MVAVGSLAIAATAEPKEAVSKTKSQPKELTFDLGKGIKLEMVLIPAGEFMMGSPDSDKDARDDEKPQHRVRITKPFYLGKYLVTQEQWRAVMGSNPSRFRGPNNPVEMVGWDECENFLKKLNAKIGNQGGKFLLPTEAQWEYACRAGSKTKYCFGDDETQLGDYAWWCKNSYSNTHPVDEKKPKAQGLFDVLGNPWYSSVDSPNKTQPVGLKKPNAWGLYDMHGNVWEMCQDWHEDGYYKDSPVDDPTGPIKGSQRVHRGGSWNSNAFFCRSAVRNEIGWADLGGDVGFRAALAPADKAAAAEPNSTPKQITNSIGMKLTLVPSGEFMMGSKESAEETAAFFNDPSRVMLSMSADFFKHEHPLHRVRITRPFYLGSYHVTRGQFLQFVDKTGYQTDTQKKGEPGALGWNSEKKEFEFSKDYSWRNTGFKQTDEHPVVHISWNDAVAFCKWLNRKEGKTYRLPTEAEWEYACRAGTTTRYYSGDDPKTLVRAGNLADTSIILNSNKGFLFTTPVGSFRPNAFGLYDMHGNAWQWCADSYDENYYTKSPLEDPTGPSQASKRVDIESPLQDPIRVLRGGSWHEPAAFCRSAHRSGSSPGSTYRTFDLGFRVCLEAKGNSEQAKQR